MAQRIQRRTFNDFFSIMELKPTQAVAIRNYFKQMQSPEDFVSLLNFVKKCKFGEKAIPFQLVQVYRFIIPVERSKKNKYVAFEIKKKSGKARLIHAPVKGLKMIQTCLNIVLQEVFQPHEAAFGFVSGKSIVDNARIHLGQQYVYNLDLKDFFPSIDQARVWARLHHPPFNLGSTDKRKKIASIIAGLSCHTISATERIKDGTARSIITDEKSGIQLCHVLPQGAPTSPTLTNIVCEQMDRRLSGLAKRFKLRYSRYADDITFSSQNFVFSKNGEFVTELRRIIEEQNFRINVAKTRLQTPGYRQEVTGLTINEQPNVTVRYIKQLRRWLHYWERFGTEKAQDYFVKDYFNPVNGRGRSDQPYIGNVISGKLLYLKMVKGAHNSTYQKLQARLDLLLGEYPEAISAMNEVKLNKKEKERRKVPKDSRLMNSDKVQESSFEKEPSVGSNDTSDVTGMVLSILASKKEQGLAAAMEIFLKQSANGT